MRASTPRPSNGVFIILISLALILLGNSWRNTASEPQPARWELKNQSRWWCHSQPHPHPKMHRLLHTPRQKVLSVVSGLWGRRRVPRQEKDLNWALREPLDYEGGVSWSDLKITLASTQFLHFLSIHLVKSPHDKERKTFHLDEPQSTELCCGWTGWITQTTSPYTGF